MVRYGQIRCNTVKRGHTRAADEIKNVAFGVSRKVDELLESKTVKAGCEILCQCAFGIVHVHIKITKQDYIRG